MFIKGTEFEPVYISTRVVFFIIMASNVVFFEYYSASYTSFMSVVKVASPFNTIDDLYFKTNYKIGSLKGTSFKTQFNVSKKCTVISSDDILQAGSDLYKKLTKERWVDVDDYEAAIDKMESEDFAFLDAAQTIYGGYGKSCRVTDSGPTIFKGNLVIAWKKDFTYAPLLNY